MSVGTASIPAETQTVCPVNVSWQHYCLIWLACCEWSKRKSDGDDRLSDSSRGNQTLQNQVYASDLFCACLKLSTMQDNPCAHHDFYSILLHKKYVLQSIITYASDHWQKLPGQHCRVLEDMSYWKLWHLRSHSHYSESHILVKSKSLQIPVFFATMRIVGQVIPTFKKNNTNHSPKNTVSQTRKQNSFTALP